MLTKITVEETHTQRGDRADPFHCMLALAIQEQTRLKDPSVDCIVNPRDYNSWTVHDPILGITIALPPDIAIKAHRWDEYRPVATPFEFELDIPTPEEQNANKD